MPAEHILKEPATLADFILRKYVENRNRLRKEKNNVLEHPEDVYDMNIKKYITDNADRIYDLALKLKAAFPNISDENHVLMAYLLHVLDKGEALCAPHSRIISAPRRMFYRYLEMALGEDYQKVLDKYKYRGVPVSILLSRVPEHGLSPNVMRKRFSWPPK